MGYTTRFVGQFDLSRQLTLDEFNDLSARHFWEDLPDHERPNGYMQWEPSKDGRGIKWDGEEKFYDYGTWLQLLIEKKLKPSGIELTGSVKWQGEDAEDRGVLSVVNGAVKATKTPPTGVKVRCPECRHCFFAEVK